jgi:predicted N-acyltransferase
VSYRTRIIDSVARIDRESWNRATRGPFFSYEWFEYVEAVCTDRFAPQYIVCHHNDRLVGVLPAFQVKTHDNAYENYLFGRLKKIAQLLLVFRRTPLLCISPFSGGGYFFSDNDYSATVLDRLLAEVEATARRQGRSDVVLMYVKQTESELIEALNKLGYTGVYLNSTGILNNYFRGFDDYLSSLSKSCRKSVKCDMNKFRKSPYTITASSDETPNADLIYELIGYFERRHPPERSFYTADKIKTCLKKMAPYSTVYSVGSADEQIAVVTLFEKDGIINTYAFGIDFDRAQKNRAYFNLLYYNTIQEMIVRKARCMNFNPMAYKVKESRGCALTKQYMYVRVLKGRFWLMPWLTLLDRQYRHKFEMFYAHAQAAYRSAGRNDP